MASTASSAAAPKAPPPAVKEAPPPPPEDDAGDGGETIDTFSSYTMPIKSLPNCILQALAESTVSSSEDGKMLAESTTTTSGLESVNANNNGPSAAKADGEVIEILESCDAAKLPPTSSSTSAAAPSNDDNDVIDLCESDVSNHAKEDDGGVKMATANNATSTAASTLLSTMTSHTSPACESALLSSVSAPRAHEQAGETLVELAKTGALSPLQLEGATLAIARHNRLFIESNNGNTTIRAGFFLGDGAGVGKGRQIAAVLKDSLCRGRTRHLWVSVSRELCLDAKRDLQDLGCHVNVHDGSELLNQTGGKSSSKGLGAGGSLGKGVLFATYPLLVSGKGKRMEEIIAWLSGGTKSGGKSSNKLEAERSFSGVIVFDECHRAKNMEAGTQTAKLVLELQARLPHARVLYCSATGVSDLKHMVYATRLGLWGAGNALYPTFQSFRQALANRGVGSLEMLALEMKQKGTFVARTLAWDGAEFETMEVKLRKKQIASYDEVVEWWYMTKRNVEAALAHMGAPAPKTLWRAYWSAHQRFFKELCICAKLPQVVEKAQKYLDEGCAIVIGLQSTGEAGTQCALEELEEQILADAGENASLQRSNNGRIDFEDIVLSSLVSTAQSIMGNFVRNHFPVSPPPEEPPKVPPIPPGGFGNEAERLQHMQWQAEADRIKALPPPEPIPELVDLRSIVLNSIKTLELPPNPLDDLIDRLGGVDEVAEMTGRSGRIVRTGENQYKFVKRLTMPTKQKQYGLSMPTSSDDADRLNIVEKRKFMEGKKSVAIISDAASTGISLHAAENSGAAHKRRVHFTIELPWAADKAIQQLGRSHRSGQRSAPIYQMCVTELGGERRFAAAVSKRMSSLGALTKGDRRAATGSDLSDFDIDSVFGRRALKRVYGNLRAIPPSAPSRNSNEILDEFVRLCGDEGTQVREQQEDAQRAFALAAAADALERVGLNGEADVKVFLNRIMGLAVLRQNLVFSLSMSTLDDVVTDAKATGEFEGSVEEVRATRITMKGSPTQIAIDKSSGASTMLTKITLDRGIALEQVIETILDDSKKQGDADDEEDDDANQFVAETGFFVSKRKIAGRHLIMFAKRKVDQSDLSDELASVVDPLGLMVVTRPNTGKNPCEMSSRDLRIKYNKIVSSRELIRLLVEGEDAEAELGVSTRSLEKAVEVIREKQSNLARQWDDAYLESNHDQHHMGLAPRISQMGLVTGAVLHVLPALEKATLFLSQSKRALKVMRVELTDSNQRIVGIKFPLDEEAVGKLLQILADLSAARAGGASDALSFRNESFTPICAKSTKWATTEPKTLKSFFGVKTPSHASSGTKRKSPPSSTSITPTPAKKAVTKPAAASQKQTSSAAANNNKKVTPSISSFFTRK